RAHWLAGAMVALSGTLSGIFVVIANAWMNTPAGFRLEGGRVVEVEPLAAMANSAALSEALHMTLAAFAAVGFAVAAIHAHRLRRDPRNLFHRRAVAIALSVGGTAALLQPLSGDLSARVVARSQPAKLAAMESHLQTETGAPLRIGPLRIPHGLSLLAFHDPHALVKGLDAFPPADRPPVAVVHLD